MTHTKLLECIAINFPLLGHPLPASTSFIVFVVAILILEIQKTVAPFDPEFTLCCIASNLFV